MNEQQKELWQALMAALESQWKGDNAETAKNALRVVDSIAKLNVKDCESLIYQLSNTPDA